MIAEIQLTAKPERGAAKDDPFEGLEPAWLEGALTKRLTKPAYVSKNPRIHATASMALKCARQIGYQMEGVPQEPHKLSTLLTFAIGDFVHNHVQAEMEKALHDFQPERPWSMGAVTGRCDGIYGDEHGKRTVVEIKSTSKVEYLAAIRNETPKADHMLQADISAIALTAPQRHIIYVCKENGVKLAVREWRCAVDVPRAEAEIARLTRIVGEVMAGRPLPRLMNGVRLNPTTKAPPCSYCNYKARCLEQGE